MRVERTTNNPSKMHHVSVASGSRSMPAGDIITLSKTSSNEQLLPQGCSLVETLSPQNLNLKEFAILLSILSTISDGYNVLTMKCYWLCRTVTEAVADRWFAGRTHGPAFNIAGRTRPGASVLGRNVADWTNLIAAYQSRSCIAMDRVQAHESHAQTSLERVESAEQENAQATEKAEKAEREKVWALERAEAAEAELRELRNETRRAQSDSC